MLAFPRDDCVLAIDHGTSGIKAALVTARGEVVAFEFAPTPIRFLDGGGIIYFGGGSRGGVSQTHQCFCGRP